MKDKETVFFSLSIKMNLPPELTRLVYEYAEDEELAKLCMLNKNFSSRVCNSDFWMKRIIDRFGLNPDEIRQFKRTNTLWAYYKHLSELHNKYHRGNVKGKGYGPAQIERIYNHPLFRSATEDLFVYVEVPKWLNTSGFEEDMLYKLIDLIVEDYVEEDYDEEDYKLGDIGSYTFLAPSLRMTVTPKLREYIIEVLKNTVWE